MSLQFWFSEWIGERTKDTDAKVPRGGSEQEYLQTFKFCFNEEDHSEVPGLTKSQILKRDLKEKCEVKTKVEDNSYKGICLVKDSNGYCCLLELRNGAVHWEVQNSGAEIH